jgi:anti-sigma factor RsiW
MPNRCDQLQIPIRSKVMSLQWSSRVSGNNLGSIRYSIDNPVSKETEGIVQMEPRVDSQLLSAFVDEELELPRRLQIEARLEQDPLLRAQVESLRGLGAAFRANAQRYVAPGGLYERVRKSSAYGGAEGSGPAHLLSAAFDWRRRFPWRTLVSSLSLVCLALWGLNLSLLQPARDNSLMQAAVSGYLHAMAGQRLVDVASADGRVVKPWLSTRLAFSPPVPESDPVDSTLIGGRIDSLEGRSVAALVYRQHDHIVDAFVWPTTDGDIALATASLRGFNIGHWSRDGMRYCVISDLPRAQLLKFALEIKGGSDKL